MDIYGIPTPDYFRIDDLLDLSNDDLFSSASTCTSSSIAADIHQPLNPSIHNSAPFNPALSTDFTDHLSVPSDDVAELEWLSQFVDDSFIEFPPNLLTGTINVRSDTSFSGKAARRKRSKAATTTATTAWTSSPEIGQSKSKKETNNRSLSPTTEGGIRRCTHCASEKTPQWRTGPLGPKTLCNACGVRYKSGRLVPEYRPAASPTFVLTQHSNSHRKVLELRRQKEMLRQQLEEP
ncbi:GATA transcription factor 4 [Ricinus communis]|uniref:GATA transcription factor n=1 Tax=Ricinus communis TaxID=3988 RepID=B9RD53_RICCO|nr:GATA transcription factor 4 [Ricinus communis]EEF50311.1 GATA transcription factor, putative [Ricinus communis]|eukprot:XP_002511642.1 GATA transcription factor 4 [Ricinus communis]